MQRIGHDEILAIQRYLRNTGRLPHEPSGVWTVQTAIAWEVLAKRHNVSPIMATSQPVLMDHIPENLRREIFEGFVPEPVNLPPPVTENRPLIQDVLEKSRPVLDKLMKNAKGTSTLPPRVSVPLPGPRTYNQKPKEEKPTSKTPSKLPEGRKIVVKKAKTKHIDVEGNTITLKRRT